MVKMAFAFLYSKAVLHVYRIGTASHLFKGDCFILS